VVAIPLTLSLLSPAQDRGRAAALQGALDRARGSWGTAPDGDALADLYDWSGSAPLWVDARGALTLDGRAAMNLLRAAGDDGLEPEDYAISALEARLSTLRVRSAPTSAGDVSDLDVAISGQILWRLRDLHQGRVDPGPLGFHLTTRPPFDYVHLIERAIARHDVEGLANAAAPPFVLYRSLRTALARYRLLAEDVNLPPRIHIAPLPCHPGQRCQDLEKLFRQLVALGDLSPASSPPGAIYDGPLVEAVRRLQDRHGLSPDGVIGTNTQAVLDVPLTQRVRQIQLALERLRWLPPLGPERLVAVNIPMFQLWAWDAVSSDAVPVFGMKVIVGRSLKTQTPIFLDEMREVVLRPYWNIPASIVRNEVLPAVRRSPDYLARQNMEIVDGAGDDARVVAVAPQSLAALAAGRLRVRQRPGPTNALGLVKFVLANDQRVYLHDTPADELFNRARRDFSHGCVRLERPLVLASWALEGSEWTSERLETAMNGAQSIYIRLAQPIQVVLFYVTATVAPEDGAVHFADDVYGHDARLDRALAAARGRARLAPAARSGNGV
jgi:murein L,D-transpeptidase YcbB/YkuD